MSFRGPKALPDGASSPSASGDAAPVLDFLPDIVCYSVAPACVARHLPVHATLGCCLSTTSSRRRAQFLSGAIFSVIDIFEAGDHGADGSFRAGSVIAREELKKQLWPSDTFVDFNVSLNKAVNRLREALGDSAEHPRFIETLPRKGYRFIGTIGNGLGISIADAAVPKQTGLLPPSSQKDTSEVAQGDWFQTRPLAANICSTTARGPVRPDLIEEVEVYHP